MNIDTMTHRYARVAAMQETAIIASIPDNVFSALQRYVQRGIPAGSFTMAVLENNLMDAIRCADDDSLAALEYIVWYVIWKVPMAAWGSRKAVDIWMAKGGEQHDNADA